MTKIDLPSNFAETIAKALGWKLAQVDDFFEFEEDKAGFFWVKLKPKKFLEKPDFKTMCALARDLGGEGYLQGMKAWKIPGPLAKKPMPSAKPEPASGVALDSLTYEKSNPPNLELDLETVEGLKKSKEILGELYPIIKDETGFVLSGKHRKAAGWTNVNLIDMKAIAKRLGLDSENPADIAIAQVLVVIHSNWQRKISNEETKKNLMILAQVLEAKGTPKERVCARVSELVPYSTQWVAELLPDEYKMPTGPKELKVLSIPEMPKFVPCEVCGVAVSSPIHVKGKFYCDKHVPKPVAPSLPEIPMPPAIPSTEARRAIQPEREPSTGYPLLPSEPTTVGPPQTIPVAPEPKPEPVDIGEFECPECHEQFIVEHVARNLHRLRVVKKIEP